VGTPLQLDRATKEREFGYFARVLMDVDMASDLPSFLGVGKKPIWTKKLAEQDKNFGSVTELLAKNTENCIYPTGLDFSRSDPVL